MVVLGTADPGKFLDAVDAATGTKHPLPPSLARAVAGKTRSQAVPSVQASVAAGRKRAAIMRVLGVVEGARELLFSAGGAGARGVSQREESCAASR